MADVSLVTKKPSVGHSSMTFRPEIQGLRAIAVLAVIGDHFAGWPHSGFVGVDIFFVISGYLITGLLVREYRQTGTISFRRFYERRIKRILPAATFVLGVTLCLSFGLLDFSRFKDLCRATFAAALFFANWHFAREGVDYFQKDLQPSPVQHYWSLSVEEQFYFVWPWLLLGMMALGVRRRWWTKDRVGRVSFVAIGVLSVVSFVWAVRESATSPTVAYFSTASRAWELGIGAAAAVVGARVAPRSPALTRSLAVMGLAGIALSLAVTPDDWGFPAPWGLLPVCSTALLLVVGGRGTGVGIRVLEGRVAQFLGDISYSLYLWHFPVVILIVTVFEYRSPLYWVVGLPLIFALSILSYNLLEQPARRSAWFESGSQFPVPVGGAYRFAAVSLAAVVAGVALAGIIQTIQPPREPQPSLVLAGATSQNGANCFGAAALDPAHACPNLNTGPAVAPLPVEAAHDTGGFVCTGREHTHLHSCQYGSRRDNAVRVALVGDSHAGQLQAALVPQLSALNWHLTTMLGVGCKLHLQNETQLGCDVALPEIRNQLLHGGYDLVIATGTRKGETATVQEYVGAMKPIVDAGIPLVVIGDGPEVPASVIQCVSRIGYTSQRRCGTSMREAYASPDVVAEGGRRAGAHVVETSDLYCRAAFCSAATGNVLVWRDTAGHITGTYARTMGPYLVSRIESALGGSVVMR